MYEIYQGNTFYRKLTVPGYTFKKDDIIHIAILQTQMGGILWEDKFTFTEETDSYVINIPASEIEKLLPGILTLEIELTYGKGLVKTNQYELIVKAAGING